MEKSKDKEKRANSSKRRHVRGQSRSDMLTTTGTPSVSVSSFCGVAYT